MLVFDARQHYLSSRSLVPKSSFLECIRQRSDTWSLEMPFLFSMTYSLLADGYTVYFGYELNVSHC